MRLLTSHGRQMERLHDDMGWMMTCMGEMYKHMGMSVPPRPSPRVYQGQGPFYTQQPDPSMSSFTQPIPFMQARPILSPTFGCRVFLSLVRRCRSFLCSTLPCMLRARPVRGTTYRLLLGVARYFVARYLRRRSSRSLTGSLMRNLTRIDEDSGL
ncbi:hypothetical protein Hanom_Chr11g01055051 [Helianthus anomalus]